MGEKETSTAASGDEAARQLNVSATPGGSPSAGIISAAVSSVGNLTPPSSDPAGAVKAGSNPLYSEPGNAGTMPAL